MYSKQQTTGQTCKAKILPALDGDVDRRFAGLCAHPPLTAASDASDPVLVGDVMGEANRDEEGVAKLSAEAESARLAKPCSMAEARAFVGDVRARVG